MLEERKKNVSEALVEDSLWPMFVINLDPAEHLSNTALSVMICA